MEGSGLGSVSSSVRTSVKLHVDGALGGTCDSGVLRSLGNLQGMRCEPATRTKKEDLRCSEEVE